ncbi:MAG: hypothetical protein ACRDMV_00055 [Streptosporangiales bacterium]
MVYGQVPNMSPPSRPALRGYAVEAIVAGLVLVFLVVAVVPTWLLGGFRQAADPLPTIEPGQAVKYGKFKITPIAAQWVKANPDDETLDPDEKPHDKLVVLVRMTNRTKKIAYNVEDDFQMTPPGRKKPAPADETRAVQDEYGSAAPLPGLPEKVELSWEMPTDTTPPSDIRVTIMRETHREGYFDKKLGWYSPHPWVNVMLPVKQAAA